MKKNPYIAATISDETCWYTNPHPPFNVGLHTVAELLVHSVSVCKQKKAAVVHINYCMLRNIEKGERGSD